MLTLSDVVDPVGVDATRFWMISKSADTTLDFDVALAASATHENPVFYVQYAHARCASILRNAVSPTQTVETPTPAFITEESLAQLSSHPTPALLAPLFNADEAALLAIAELILELDRFESVVISAARQRSAHLIARYAQELAANFHSVYNVCRMLTDDPEVTQARLALVLAVQKTLAQALQLLGVSAPESM
jgi:arginyl-tRNA synthetase